MQSSLMINGRTQRRLGSIAALLSGWWPRSARGAAGARWPARATLCEQRRGARRGPHNG